MRLRGQILATKRICKSIVDSAWSNLQYNKPYTSLQEQNIVATLYLTYLKIAQAQLQVKIRLPHLPLKVQTGL